MAGEPDKQTSGSNGEGLALRVLQRKIDQLCDIDLSLYKPKQVRRLLDSALRRYGVSSYGDLLRRLEDDEILLQDFKGRMSINVSEFFRDPARFEFLNNSVLEELLRSRSGIHVWSAGCSIGCEPYSVAMLLRDRGALQHSRLLGTDIDDESLKRASEALYWEGEIRHVPRHLRQRFFSLARNVEKERLPTPQRRKTDGSLENLYQLSEKLRAAVACRSENLFDSSYQEEFDLIVCRNVAIYFTEEAKRRLYHLLCRALRPGGYLFVGGTEIIFRADSMGLENPAPFFYRKDK